MLIVILVTNNALAQKEASNWCLGERSVINFNEDSLYHYNDSLFAFGESIACISDTSGKLLFTCNGRKIFDRNFNLMQNGDSLKGNPSCIQILAIPFPNSDSLYYVFHLGGLGSDPIYDDNPEQKGIWYSIVNIKGNLGLGEVISKNNYLDSLATERISAVRHANGIDKWVTIKRYNEQNFYTYLITESGLNLNPVLSNIGSLEIYKSNWIDLGTGQMKFSHNGKFLALASCDSGKIELYNFNNYTGVISNYRVSQKIIDYKHISVGLEFSLNDSILYTSQYEGTLGGPVIKFNLYSGLTNPLLSFTQLTNNNIGPVCLQLGIDGNIYGIGRNYDSNIPSMYEIDRIVNPNSWDSSYLERGIYYFENDFSVNLTGLPNYEQSIFLKQTPNSVKKGDVNKEAINIYPNPTKGQLAITGLTIYDLKQITIYDVTAKQVYCKSVIIDDNTLNESIELSKLESGTYFVELKFEDGSIKYHKIELLK